MIPKAFITAWSKHSPWINNHLVEQDLIIERALYEIFSEPELMNKLAFRGGTALHKLFFKPSPRYSEDIDLVQINPGPIGDILTLIRQKLSFIGEANYKKSQHNNTLTYQFETEFEPVIISKLKIEINTREHFSLYGYKDIQRKVENPWFTGISNITTYSIEELLATKLRALYQRRKGRDLFDLWYVLTNLNPDTSKVVKGFHQYLSEENLHVNSEQFISNIEFKLLNEMFTGDIAGLIRPDLTFDFHEGWNLLKQKIVVHI